MIRPRELESDTGRVIWDTMRVAAAGDTPALQRLLERDPSLGRAGYFYTQPIHFAVRAGHLEAVQLLLAAGADPEWNGYHDGSLIEMARYRGHESVARLLEELAVAADELRRATIIQFIRLRRRTMSCVSGSFSMPSQLW